MPPVKGSFRNYSEKTMRVAIEDVRMHQTLITTAARKFGVPRITLKYKVEGKSPTDRKMGSPLVLSKAEEDEIRQWIEKRAAAGFSVKTNELENLKKMKRLLYNI